uniref:SJCHGC01999 protein n=1 Tax=Schistosoma japonicum TaxID=6182 RepID=Q5BTC8_SCHJA|nr:SJCHGC01999 protein [Schistosoma japonicum]
MSHKFSFRLINSYYMITSTKSTVISNTSRIYMLYHDRMTKISTAF